MSRARKVAKWLAIGLGGLLIVGVIVYALGPRVQVDEARMLPVRPPPEAPAELDRYLAEREARLPDLVPGTEKRIVWAAPENPARTPLALVYVHGYSATRQETAPVADEVARALGANLFYTRLRGHGRPGEALAQATAEQWMEDVVEAMAIGERIGERVVLIGCSTGAALAVWVSDWLASDRAHGPATAPPIGLVLLAPNFGVANPAASLLTGPWGEALVEMLLGEQYTWEPANDDQRRYWTWSHPSRAILAMQAMVDHVARLPVDRPRVPALAMWASHDALIDLDAAEAWVAASPLRQKRVFTDDVPRGNHVMAGDIMAPSRNAAVIEATLDFIRGLPTERPD